VRRSVKSVGVSGGTPRSVHIPIKTEVAEASKGKADGREDVVGCQEPRELLLELHFPLSVECTSHIEFLNSTSVDTFLVSLLELVGLQIATIPWGHK
jgi:hypothetical protein